MDKEKEIKLEEHHDEEYEDSIIIIDEYGAQVKEKSLYPTELPF